MRRCISIRGCVRPSVRRSVRPSVGPSVRLSRVIFRRVLGASFAVYPALFIIFIFIFTCSQALMEILWNKIQKNLMWCITIRFYFNMYIDDKCIRVEMTGTHSQCLLWEKSKLTWSYYNLEMSACLPCFSFFRAAALKVLKCIRSNIGVIFPSLPPQRTLTQG